jgi:hypothetical protein
MRACPGFAVGLALALSGSGAVRLHAQDATVRVGGVIYSEYRVFLSDTADHRNEFDVTRAYVNVTGRFDHGISSRVTADLYRDTDGSLAYRLKYAYFGWQPEGSIATLRFGMLNTPFVGWEESLWGYRMQGTIPMDRAGYLTSSDIGAGVDLAAKDERINAQFAVVNGEGYNRPSGGKNLDVEGRASVRLLATDDASATGGLRLTGAAHIGKRADDGPRNRFLGMASWRSKLVTLASELAATKDGPSDPDDPDDPDVDGRLIAAYGVLNIPDSRIALLARVDVVDPNTDVADNGWTRFIGGASYRLGSNVRLLLDLDHVSYQGPIGPAVEASRSRLLFQTEVSF